MPDTPAENEAPIFSITPKKVMIGAYRVISIVLLAAGGFMAKEVYSKVTGYGDQILQTAEQSRQAINELKDSTNTRLADFDKWRVVAAAERFTKEDSWKVQQEHNTRFNEHERRLNVVESGLASIKTTTERTEKILDQYFNGRRGEPASPQPPPSHERSNPAPDH